MSKPPGALRLILESACDEHDFGLGQLTVLSPQVDPYRFDTPASHRDGAWLGEVFTRLYGPTRRAHWRGVHYAIVADGKLRKPDGSVYVNTDADWTWLTNEAAKAARWLGYIGFDRITDNRNAPAIIHRKARVAPASALSIELEVEIPDADDIEPAPLAAGFVARQAFHFAIFGEKSSLEDVVLPTARQYEADLYLPTGEISDTLVYQMAKDAAEDGRPLVLFTLSDCDPAGRQMPVSIARKLQAFKDLFFPELAFEVVPVALTPDQVTEHGLPETPLKEKEKRAQRWKEAFGIEQTEIDALTIPSRRATLQRMLKHAFKPYIDPTLDRRVSEAKEEWYGAAQEVIDSQIDPDRLAQIRQEAAEKLEALREEIDHINEKLQLEAGPHFDLPPIDVPAPSVGLDDLDPARPTLVSFDDDWVTASQTLIKHKSYGKVG
jgi:hypothetical protein